MNEWNATTYEAKENLLRVVRREADGMFAMAANRDRWTERPPAANGRPGTSSVT